MLRIDVNDETIEDISIWDYTINLNGLNSCEIYIDGSSKFQESLLTNDNTIRIYRNNVLDFKGKIEATEIIENGLIVVRAVGIEKKGLANIPVNLNSLGTNGIYKNIGNHIIFNEIISLSNLFTVGTSEFVDNIDLKINPSHSLFNSIIELINETQQDFKIEYENDEISLFNNLGTNLNLLLTDGIEISNITKNTLIPEGRKVEVYGKGTGNNQIRATATDPSYSLGDNIKKIVNPNISTVVQAQKIADENLKSSKLDIKNFSFNLIRTDFDLNIGDIITIDSSKYNINNQELRIAKIKRGIKNSKEFCKIVVVDPESTHIIKESSRKLAELERKVRDVDTAKQWDLNTLSYEAIINANNSNPLRIGVMIPEDYIKDEFGEIKVLDFKLNYEIDKFRSDVGTSTIDVNKTNLNVGNNPNKTNLNVHNITNKTNLNVFGQLAGTSNTGYALTNNFISITGNNTWRGVGLFANLSNNDYFMHYIFGCFTFTLNTGEFGASWSCQVFVRVRNSTTNEYFPNSTGLILVPIGFSGQGIFRQIIPFSILIPRNWKNNSYILEYKIQNENYWTGANELDFAYYGVRGHSHSNFVDENNHGHGTDVSENNHNHTTIVNEDNHGHGLNIGEGVSESSSINATGVSEIRLYYWNGTTKILKNTITDIPNRIVTDLDISNNGQFPDQVGYWIIDISTNNSTPDLVKGIVTLKHLID